jgi:type III secretory pathway component EscU
MPGDRAHDNDDDPEHKQHRRHLHQEESAQRLTA